MTHYRAWFADFVSVSSSWLKAVLPIKWYAIFLGHFSNLLHGTAGVVYLISVFYDINVPIISFNDSSHIHRNKILIATRGILSSSINSHDG